MDYTHSCDDDDDDGNGHDDDDDDDDDENVAVGGVRAKLNKMVAATLL